MAQSQGEELALEIDFDFVALYVNVLAQASVTKTPQTRWLKQQAFISHSSGGWKSKIKVLADPVSGQTHCLVGRGSSLCSLTWQREQSKEATLPYLFLQGH